MRSRNGGVYVFGGARQDFAISACKAAAPHGRQRELAGAGARQPERRHADGNGPGSDGWVVYFIIDAPTQADLDLEATNGPIYVAHVTGATTARAQNGPIKLLDVSGRVSARTAERADRLRGWQRHDRAGGPERPGGRAPGRQQVGRWLAHGQRRRTARSSCRCRAGSPPACASARHSTRRGDARAATTGDGPGTIPRARWSSAAARWQ